MFSSDLFLFQTYTLTYMVFDEKFSNETRVVVQILDVNDNPPQFTQPLYNVTNLDEEEEGITRTNRKYLTTVRPLSSAW